MGSKHAGWHFDGYGINDGEGRRLLRAQISMGNEFDDISVLAAAAPDLLAALEGLVAVLDDGGWIGDSPEPGSPGYIARAAIAKACGHE